MHTHSRASVIRAYARTSNVYSIVPPVSGELRQRRRLARDGRRSPGVADGQKEERSAYLEKGCELTQDGLHGRLPYARLDVLVMGG